MNVTLYLILFSIASIIVNIFQFKVNRNNKKEYKTTLEAYEKEMAFDDAYIIKLQARIDELNLYIEQVDIQNKQNQLTIKELTSNDKTDEEKDAIMCDLISSFNKLHNPTST